MRGCNEVGGCGNLQLSIVNAGGRVAKWIIEGGKTNGNSHSYIHAFSPLSGSKPHTLFCLSHLLPCASATLKLFPAQFSPPLPRVSASLQHPFVRHYFQSSSLRVHPPRQALALDLIERFGPRACHAFSFLSSMTAAVCRRNALTWLISPICLLVDLRL